MSCYYVNLEHEALLHLQGPDARSFLQGQVTCDTRKLEAGRALPGTYCTLQGRVVCDFLLCALAQDHLLLRMRRDIRATGAALLAKYIVFSKARLEPEREDWQVMACWGADAADALRELFDMPRLEKYGAWHGEGFVLVQLDDAGQQFECYLERVVATALQPRLKEFMQAAAEPEWQALQIAAGIARIEAPTTGEFIPQLLNYDLTGHISFNKGCYTGQEVVARLHYRGTPKRRLYRAETALAGLEGRLVAAGDPLYSADGARAVGNVINRVETADGRLLLLVTSTAAGTATGLHLLDPSGPLLRTEAMPYPVPEK